MLNHVKNIKNYFMQLAANAIPYYEAVTEFKLQQAKSGNGITYSQIVPTMVGRIDPSERQKVKEYSLSMRSVFNPENFVLDQKDVQA